MNSTDIEPTVPEVQKPEVPARKRQKAGQLTEWQRFFLARLDTLLERQREALSQPGGNPEEQSMLSRSIYSTYLDCQSEGVVAEALRRIAASSPSKPSAN